MTSLLEPSSPWHTEQTIYANGRRAECIRNPEEPLDSEIIRCLLDIAKSDENEVCGLISSDEDIFIVKNVHEEPTHNFYMQQDSFKRAVNEIVAERHEQILGIFHTHPNNWPWPTPRDLLGWPNPELGWRYFIVTNKEVLEWKLINDQSITA